MFSFLFLIATVYFEDNFNDDDWEQHWVYSRHRPTKGQGKMGTFRLSSGAYYGNQRAQRGIQTVDDGAYYQITSKFKQPFNTSGKDFILQYTIRFENGYECSGGYIKLLNSSAQPIRFSEGSPYSLMFGPDVCKPNTHKLMFIINRNETTRDNHQYIDSFSDELTHAYTLIIFANRSYEIRLDGKKEHAGDLDTDFELGGTSMIPDPDDTMPEDWDNRKMIPDPDDHKPSDWDDRQIIPDLTAQQPAEWRESVHGKWTPPLIQNPNYRGIWKQKMIENPNYNGEWVPKMIKNPNSLSDPGFGVFQDLSYVGIEVFQITAGSIFDNILITDDLEYAEKQLRLNFLQYQKDEFSMYNRVLQDKKAEAELRKLREKDNAELTDDLFYTKSYSSSSSTTSSDSTIGSNQGSDDDISSELLERKPTIADFQFPYNIDHNSYFIIKRQNQMRKKSASSRKKWKEDLNKLKEEMEVPEGLPL